MNTSAQNKKIADLLKSLRDGTLIPKPNFQRRTVWTNKDKIAFIDTILQSFPFPEIYIASGEVNTSKGEATDILVDGQQRVRTIDDYFKGNKPFNLARSIIRYKDLTEDEKKAFLSYDVAVRHLGTHSDDIIREIFTRMNATSYDLNDFERYNAVYLGEFKNFVEEISLNDFFAKVHLFSAADIRRMKDLSYIASLAGTIITDYFNRDDEIETFLDQYNEVFDEKAELLSRFTSTIEAIESLGLPDKSRAFRKIDFYTLFVEMDRHLNRSGKGIDAERLGKTIAVFFDMVDKQRDVDSEDSLVRQYHATTLQNTNDRSQRIARGSVVRQIIEKWTA